jgi:uncharacterized membrane protein YgdD (TMEM256/DUF423 family)
MKTLFSLASLSMAVGVACGAFGAHGLRGTIPDSDLLIWEKSVFYQLVHSLAILITINAAGTYLSERAARQISKLLLVGIVIFSGTLYGLVLTNVRWLGAITPLGGTSFICAWLILAAHSLKRSPGQ